jgi:hypothetical protein
VGNRGWRLLRRRRRRSESVCRRLNGLGVLIPHDYPTTTAQEWYDGTAAQDGLLVKDATDGSTNNDLTFDTEGAEGEHAPMFTFEWSPNGIGDKSQFTSLPEPLTNKMSLEVNAASGNLGITNNDLEIAGRGLSFSAARTWNSLSSEVQEQYGDGWAGNAQIIVALPDGSVYYTNQSGAEFLFIKSGSSFTTPPGIEALLCAAGSPKPCPTTLPSGTAYRLIFDKSQTHVDFKTPIEDLSYPTEIEDRYKNSLKAGYTAGTLEPTSWTDTEGRKIVSNISNEVGPLEITDESGKRKLKFLYSGLHLITYTDADEKTTQYGYTGDLITKITTPRGEVVKLSYNSTNQVTKIIRTTNTEHTTGPTTTFEYDEAGKAPSPCTSAQKATIVKDPDWTAAKAHETIFCANSLDEVEETVDANGNATEASYNPLGNVTSMTDLVPELWTGFVRGWAA